MRTYSLVTLLSLIAISLVAAPQLSAYLLSTQLHSDNSTLLVAAQTQQEGNKPPDRGRPRRFP